MQVITSYGRAIDFDAAVMHMDDELREMLNSELAPCSEQRFYDFYVQAHLAKYGEEFEPDKLNGQW